MIKQRVIAFLYDSVDASSLAFFRIGFGIIHLVWAWKYLSSNLIYSLYIYPDILLPYPGLDWVLRLPGYAMYLPFFVLFICSLGITLGFYFRLSAILFFISYIYIFLLDFTGYNNHYYLVILLAFWLVFMNAHTTMSMDRYLGRTENFNLIPFWNIWIIRFQLIIVYFFGGFAKLMNIDWWLHASQLKNILAPFYSHTILHFLSHPISAYFLAWSGMLFDLGIGGLLFFKRTRMIGVYLIVGFHAFNYFILFSPYTAKPTIGIFPFLGILTGLMFLEPNFPREWLTKLSTWVELNLETPIMAPSRAHTVFSILICLVIGSLLVILPITAWLTQTPLPFSWIDATLIPKN